MSATNVSTEKIITLTEEATGRFQAIYNNYKTPIIKIGDTIFQPIAINPYTISRYYPVNNENIGVITVLPYNFE